MLTISLHQDGRTLFPGTGFVDELGEGDAVGTKVNVPLPRFTGDEGWVRAFREIVPPLVESFRPYVLVTQLGCDSHYEDPLAHLLLTTAAYRETASLLHELAHTAASGRWLATGGGGYRWATVVPRAWTLYFADMAGVDLPDELPAAWLQRAQQEAGEPIPVRLSEPRVSSPHVDDEAVGRAIDATKRAIFPFHGLT